MKQSKLTRENAISFWENTFWIGCWPHHGVLVLNKRPGHPDAKLVKKISIEQARNKMRKLRSEKRRGE